MVLSRTAGAELANAVDRAAADRTSADRAAVDCRADPSEWNGAALSEAAALTAWEDRNAIADREAIAACAAWDRDHRKVPEGFDGADGFNDENGFNEQEQLAFNAMFSPANSTFSPSNFAAAESAFPTEKSPGRRAAGDPARTSWNSREALARQKSKDLARHGETTLKMALSPAAAFPPALARELSSSKSAKGHFSDRSERLSRKGSERLSRTDSYAAPLGYVPPRNEEAHNLEAARLRSVPV
jgi:hypothetical protein